MFLLLRPIRVATTESKPRQQGEREKEANQ